MKKGIKIIFWSLVAVNVIFFAVMRSGLFDTRQILTAQPELLADKIILLKASHSAANLAQSTPAITVPAEPVADVPPVAQADTMSCYEWGDFSGVELERASNALNKLQLGNKLTQRDTEHSIGFWVYIAPLKDKAAVAQKVAQLKARGVTEYFVVQEAGEWLDAISLGMFKTREAAQKFLEGLNAKDVRSAKVGERASKTKTTTFVMSGLDAAKNEKLLAMQKDFQGTELKRVACH